MGIFSNLFGSSHNDNSNKIEINSAIAEMCFRGIGYSSRDESIGYSILGIAKSQEVLSDVNFNENYFHEELVFYLMSILELQDRYQYVDGVIGLMGLNSEETSEVDHNKIMLCLRLVGMEIAKQRTLKLGLPILKTSLEISSHVEKRSLEYGESLMVSIQCKDPMTMGNFSAGLSPRDHPLKIYLGKVADNISESLSVSYENILIFTILEASILNSYGTILKVSQEFMNMEIS